MEDLIRRSDAIAILEDLQSKHLQFCLMPFRIAIEKVQALPSAESTGDLDNAIYEYVKEGLMANPYNKSQEWISCSERLPKEGETVLVQFNVKGHRFSWEEQRYIEFGRISSDREDAKGIGWEWLNESGADYWEPDYGNLIVAWMPLPEPWKGADDETANNKSR